MSAQQDAVQSTSTSDRAYGNSELNHDVFLQRMEKETSWRKKELQVLSMGIRQVSDSGFRASLRRACIVLFCAHLEGFIGDISNLFLHFLQNQELKLAQLSDNFIVLLKPDGVEIPLDTARKNLQQQGFKQGTVLRPGELRRVVWLLGLNYETLEGKEMMLKELREKRNKIAHGKKTNVGDEELSRMATETSNLIESFESEIEFSVRNNTYLKSSSERNDSARRDRSI